MDVHQATISVAVRDSRGNLVMEGHSRNESGDDFQFIRGLRGSLYVDFEKEPGPPGCTICSASRHPSAGLRSAQECPVEGREQETTASMHASCRAVVSEQAQPGVSRRAGIRTLKDWRAAT